MLFGALPLFLGKQIGLMLSVMGTLSLSLSKAISLSKLRKLKDPAMARRTNLDSGLFVSLHLSSSPKVTLIMNHMNLKEKSGEMEKRRL